MQTVDMTSQVQGIGVGDIVFAVTQHHSLIALKVTQIQCSGVVIAYHTEPTGQLNDNEQTEYERSMKKLLTTTGVCLCLQNAFLFKNRTAAVQEAVKRLDDERNRLKKELSMLDRKRQLLQGKPYVILDENSQSCIDIAQNDAGKVPGVIVFRMVRSDETERLWSLHAIRNGLFDPLPVTRNQYRADLIERLQAGVYDRFLSATSDLHVEAGVL